MPDLLLELRSEEIPARMQRKAAGDLRKMVTDGLVEAGLTYEGCQEYWTPRRLALDIRGVTARSRDVREERKGPSVKAPEPAIQGFLRSAGLSDIGQAEIQSDPKKGEFYVARIVRPGRAAEEIVAELLPAVIRAFPWPKSMRWGAASGPKGTRYGTVEGRGGEALRWVRPLQSILCTFGPETADPVVVDFEVDGIRSGNVTYGHRFHAPEAIAVRRFHDYVAKLEAARVVLDAERRKEIILHDARNLAFANGLELVEDEALLEEVSGLVEWPMVLLGAFEPDYLEIPAEVIRLTIRANQKCFVTRPAESVISPLEGEMSAKPTEGVLSEGTADRSSAAEATPTPDLRSDPPRHGEGGASGLAPSSPSTGEVAGRSPVGGGETSLSNRFLLTANIEAKDGGAEIVRGNGKVVRARLSDALYFWRTDQADLPDLARLDASAERLGLKRDASGKLLPLDQRMARLDHLGVTFHAKLGSQGERVERIARLAEEIAPVVARGSLPLEGRVAAERPGGALSDERDARKAPSAAEATPTAAFGGTSPSRGEEAAALARRAALLAKADLQSEVVGEFPELQGVMGRKYALLQGEHASVAAAVEEHYKPQGPSDRVPTDPVSIAVALADKLDTLVGFWAIDEKPTGSKDPYALRRAALGVIRIVVENGVAVRLTSIWRDPLMFAILTNSGREMLSQMPTFHEVVSTLEKSLSTTTALEVSQEMLRRAGGVEFAAKFPTRYSSTGLDLLSFFHDRLKVYLRDQGARHDLIDAVLASKRDPSSGPSGHLLPQGEKGGRGGAAGTPSPLVGEGGSARSAETGEGSSATALNDDLLMIVRRVEALGALLDTEDGRNLLAGTRRAVNILAIEAKKGTRIAAAVDPALLAEPAESALYEAVNQAEKKAAQAIRDEDFFAAMQALAALREPVDSFFEGVLVNVEDEAVRANRLALLARIRAATDQVADFSKIAG